MKISSRCQTIATSHGVLAVEEVGQGGIPVLLIHGNSSSRAVFRNQLAGQLAETHHLIAFDLPGHGESSDAPDPERSYTRSGLAQAALELLERLGVTDVVLLGWSLGGHVAIEMVPRLPRLRGLLITGAPPVARGGMAEGFQGAPHMGAAGKQELSDAEVDAFLQVIFGGSADSMLRAAVRRTDGRFRKRLFEAARAGDGVDQRQVVETSPVPLAVVNGGADRIVKLDYFDRVAYRNLWEGHCHRLEARGHAAFWEAPDEFDLIAARFLRDVERLPRP